MTKESKGQKPPIQVAPKSRSVIVYRPKGTITRANDIDNIEVRDGSLLLMTRDANALTCRVVFGPGQWLSVNVAPV
jgi:hypothetical protein